MGERRGLAGQWGSQNTHIWSALSYVCGLWHRPKNYNSDINDQSQTIITKKIIMKIFEIFQ